MSPSRGQNAEGGKRKRSLSPGKSKSPEAKRGKLDSLLSFLTPSKAKPDAEKKKKRLSFGAPVVHAFDAFSPPCRRRPLYDNASFDASKMAKGLARARSRELLVCDVCTRVRARGPTRTPDRTHELRCWLASGCAPQRGGRVRVPGVRGGRRVVGAAAGADVRVRLRAAVSSRGSAGGD